MRFENLRKLVVDENDKFIEEGENYILNMGGNSAYATSKRMNQYSDGLITLDKLNQYACKRMRKQYEKRLKEKLEQIKSVENSEFAKRITIRFWWTYTHYYIYHAEVTIDGKQYKGTASGCGYDKQSTTVARCFNEDYGLLKYLYMKKDEKPNKSNHDLFGYGLGYGALPCFEGGIGMNSFIGILNGLGFENDYIPSDKGDTYIFKKKDK